MNDPKPLTKEERKRILQYRHPLILRTDILRYEATVADLERQLEETRERIVELEARLQPNSALGLGNELAAWEAASDEALSGFEEGLDTSSDQEG